jgi:hypothetical protein
MAMKRILGFLSSAAVVTLVQRVQPRRSDRMNFMIYFLALVAAMISLAIEQLRRPG